MAYYDIGEAFQKIEEEMIASMSRNLKRHLKTEKEEGLNYAMWQAEQLAALQNFKKDNKKLFSKYFSTINSQLEDVLRKANETGLMTQEANILEAIKGGFKLYDYESSGSVRGSFFKINDRKLNALIKATKSDMTKAETAMLRTANDEYRKIIFNAEAFYNTGAGTLQQCVDMATRDFLAKGITCIEYANGARVGIDVYSRMALRTAQTRAYLTGEATKRDEWGVNTVIVNKRGVACPMCLKWVGKVYYDDVWGHGTIPTIPKYPRLSEAVAGGLYHPNCKDIHTTFFEGVSSEPEPMTQKQIDEANRVYALEQQQRYNERQIRKYKRLWSGSVDPDNALKYKTKMQEWQTRQNDFIKANSDVLKRRPELEKIFQLPDNLQFGSNSYDPSQDIRDMIKNEHEHVWIETITKQPKCEEPGEKTLKCAICDEEKTEEIPPLGHDIRTTVYSPTCTTEGYTIQWCTRCAHWEKTDVKPALGHDFGDWIITRQPTATEYGRKQKVCSRCGEKKYTTIPKLKAKPQDAQIKALEDSISQLDTEIAALNQNSYSGIWKDSVTVSDYSAKKSAIAAKKQYFLDKLNEAKAYGLGQTAEDKWQSLIDLTDDFELKGKEYETLLAQRRKNQDALDVLRPPSTAGVLNNPFTPDAYGRRKTDAWNNRFRIDTDADNYYRPIYDKQCSKLTDQNKFGIWQYTHNSHPMNRPLSGYDGAWGRYNYKGIDKVPWSNENGNYDNILQTATFQKKFGNKTVGFNKVRDYKDTIADLTQAIEKCEFDKDTWVVRGSDKNGLIGMLEHSSGLNANQIESIINSGDTKQLQALIGKRGQSHSFMSTGIVDGKGFSGDVSYKIYMPKGTKAVYAEPQSYWGDTLWHAEKIYTPGASYSGISREAEIIIQRGTTYRVADIQYTYGTNIEVTLEVVDQPDYFKTGYEHTFDDGLTSEN